MTDPFNPRPFDNPQPLSCRYPAKAEGMLMDSKAKDDNPNS